MGFFYVWNYNSFFREPKRGGIKKWLSQMVSGGQEPENTKGMLNTNTSGQAQSTCFLGFTLDGPKSSSAFLLCPTNSSYSWSLLPYSTPNFFFFTLYCSFSSILCVSLSPRKLDGKDISLHFPAEWEGTDFEGGSGRNVISQWRAKVYQMCCVLKKIIWSWGSKVVGKWVSECKNMPYGMQRLGNWTLAILTLRCMILL